jgi:hypothetical protein
MPPPLSNTLIVSTLGIGVGSETGATHEMGWRDLTV